jgi:ATP-dependent helicase/nuclease subunit A
MEKLGISPSAGMFAPEYDDDIFDIEYAEPELSAKASDEETLLTAEPDEEIYEELRRLTDHQYDTALSEMPAKLSVTQITKKMRGTEEKFDFRLRRPKFASADSSLTGAERGTAIHTFFQYCNFDNAINSPDTEIERIMEAGYISRTEAASIDRNNVSAFFESSLYHRISSADKLWREKKFMVAVSQLEIEDELMQKLRHSDGMIKGIIDLMFEENGEIIIVDYKSDRGVSEKTFAERYSIQLKLYSAAIELTMKKKVHEAYLYSFELRKAIKIAIK